MDQGIIQNLKVHYRGLVLRRYIAEVEAGTTSSYNISLLDATRYLVRAWDAVTPTTIANCFRKAGFRPDGTARDGMEGVAETEKTYDGLFERLRAFVRVPDDINFSDFVTADEEVVARAAFTDEEIAAAATTSPDVPDADQAGADMPDMETEAALSIALNAAEAYRLLEQLRGFLEKRSDNFDRDALDRVDSMIGSVVDKGTVQSRIDSYFPRV